MVTMVPKVRQGHKDHRANKATQAQMVATAPMRLLVLQWISLVALSWAIKRQLKLFSIIPLPVPFMPLTVKRIQLQSLMPLALIRQQCQIQLIRPR